MITSIDDRAEKILKFKNMAIKREQIEPVEKKQWIKIATQIKLISVKDL